MKNKVILITHLLTIIIVLAGLTGCEIQGIKLLSPQVEMQANPQGIATTTPRFSWQISSTSPNLQQQSYQIQVAENEIDLKQGKNLIWDSGIVTSSESILIPFEGQNLTSGNE